MTLSKILDRDEQGNDGYQRWEPPQVRSPHSAAGLRGEDSEFDGVPRYPTADELKQIQDTAYTEGYELGCKEGLQAGQKDVHAEIQRLGQIITALTEPLSAIDEEVEQELVMLSIAIAGQLVRRELKIDPGEVIAVVREALAMLPVNSQHIKIALHPEDALIVREVLSVNEEGPWQIVEDSVLTRGGCRVETEYSALDASVEKRLSAVAAELLGGDRVSDDKLPDK